MPRSLSLRSLWVETRRGIAKPHAGSEQEDRPQRERPCAGPSVISTKCRRSGIPHDYSPQPVGVADHHPAGGALQRSSHGRRAEGHSSCGRLRPSPLARKAKRHLIAIITLPPGEPAEAVRPQ